MNKEKLKETLESLKGHNKLKNAVIDYYIDRELDSYEELQQEFSDLAQHGCISGMISSLIYYSDTTKFYNDYKEEINQMLSELKDGTGLSLEELFGDKFDKEDPLVLEDNNQNLMAWYAFEEMSSKLSEELEEEIDISIEDEYDEIDKD